MGGGCICIFYFNCKRSVVTVLKQSMLLGELNLFSYSGKKGEKHMSVINYNRGETKICLFKLPFVCFVIITNWKSEFIYLHSPNITQAHLLSWLIYFKLFVVPNTTFFSD